MLVRLLIFDKPPDVVFFKNNGSLNVKVSQTYVYFLKDTCMSIQQWKVLSVQLLSNNHRKTIWQILLTGENIYQITQIFNFVEFFHPSTDFLFGLFAMRAKNIKTEEITLTALYSRLDADIKTISSRSQHICMVNFCKKNNCSLIGRHLNIFNITEK